MAGSKDHVAKNVDHNDWTRLACFSTVEYRTGAKSSYANCDVIGIANLNTP